MDKALRGAINGDIDSETDDESDEEEGLKGDIDNLKDDIDEFIEEDDDEDVKGIEMTSSKRRRASMNPLHQIYVMNNVAPVGQADPKYQQLFKSLDQDNSQSIDLAELKAFVKNVKEENALSDLQVELIFHSMDVNGDEKLSYEEFVHLCELMDISPDSDQSAFAIRAKTFDSSISKLKQGLPPNWVMHVDPKTGKEYYHNFETKETTWEKPTNDLIMTNSELLDRLNYLDLFENLDKDQSNSIDIKEFRSFVCKSQGENSAAIKQLEDMLRTSTGKYKELELEEFVVICNNLGINSDGSYRFGNNASYI